MNVKKIGSEGSGVFSDINSQNKRIGGNAQSNAPKITGSSDKLEISTEAKKLQIIKNNIETGYYNREDIVKKTASYILSKTQL